jgi:hypothetical protein
MSCSGGGCHGSHEISATNWAGNGTVVLFLPGRGSCLYEAPGMDRDQLLKLLLPLWGVAFIAGFMMACR